MALVKDRGHPTGLPGNGIHYQGSIESWQILLHGIGRVWPPLGWRWSWAGATQAAAEPAPFVFTSNSCMHLERRETTKSEPLGDLGFTPFSAGFFSKGLASQRDISGSAAGMTMAVCEDGWLRHSCEFVRFSLWAVKIQLSTVRLSQWIFISIFFHKRPHGNMWWQPVFCAVWSTAHFPVTAS